MGLDLSSWLPVFFEAGVRKPLACVWDFRAGVRASLRVFLLHHKFDPAVGREMQKISFLKSLIFLAILLSFGISQCSLVAQQPNQQQLNYDGQKVGEVDLVARPTMNVEDLRSLVLQKAGEAYSTEKVQSTVAALQRTGQFSKVDVEVTPKPTGLQVEFVMQPAYYIGIIYFPGATEAFAYSRLLTVVNYPSEEPYDASRVKAAEPALEHFFANNGYFFAKVQSETQFDQAHDLANLTFHVTLNRRAMFGHVQVKGPPPAEAARLVSSLGSIHARIKGASVKPGKPYDPDRLRAAVTFMQNTLGSEKRLASQVGLEPPTYHPETNRADVVFQVTLGPTVSVKVTGASISNSNLRKLIPIYEENAVDEDLVKEGERNLVSFFQTQGYFDIKVHSQVEDQPGDVAVVYQIERGNRHRVENVNIAGNHHFDVDQLKDQVVVEKGGLYSRGKFSQDLLKRSVKNLTAYYQNAGFTQVNVQPEVVDREPKVYVTFEIAEGEQTLVGSLKVEGNKTLSLDALVPDGLKLSTGQPYSVARLDEDRNRIVASYLNLGYMNVNFKSTVEPLAEDAHRVAVTYLIEEGPQTHIGQVVYLGAQHTRESFIKRNITVRPGAPLGEGTMLESESKLYNLGDFDWANVSPRKPITDQQQEEVLVKVHEGKLNSLTYGVGFESTARSGSLSTGVVSLPGLPTVGLPAHFTVIEKNIISPSGSVEYSRQDLRGLGETASVSAFVSVLDQKGTFTYTIPQFQGSNWSALWSASGERTTMNPLFTAVAALGSMQVSKNLDAAKTERLQLRIGFQHTTLSNLLIQNFVPLEDLSVRSSFLGVTYIRDARDKPLDAHKGIFQTVDFRLVPKLIGSSDNFVRLSGQTSYYWQIKPWMVWANNGRLGFEKAFAGSHVPFSEQFFSGGPDSLRGFPLNGAGPQGTAVLCTSANDPSTCTAKITVPTGGRQLVIFNSEGRFPIPLSISFLKDKLGGAIFYDGGNVYRHIGFGGLFSNWSNTVGFGLRYQTPVGPVRIDIGRNLSPVPGLKATEIFVTLGQAF